jgi:hypothetical protein
MLEFPSLIQIETAWAQTAALNLLKLKAAFTGIEGYPITKVTTNLIMRIPESRRIFTSHVPPGGSVPEGRLTIARRFNAGSTSKMIPVP